MQFFKTHLTPHMRWALLGIAGVLLALLIFHAGLVAGAHRGLHPRAGEHGFHSPLGLPGFTMPDGYLPHGHGAVGTIATVTLPTLTITESEGDIETVFIATSTLIDSPQGTSSALLVPGAHVIIFGNPDEAVERIDAKVIHLLP